MPVGSCHQIGRPGGARKGFFLWAKLEIYADWLTLWHLFAALFSLYFGNYEPDGQAHGKYSQGRGHAFDFFKDKGELSLSSFSNRSGNFMCTNSEQATHFGRLKHLNKDLLCDIIESNLSSVYQGIHRRKVQAMVWMLCLPEASHPLCSGGTKDAVWALAKMIIYWDWNPSLITSLSKSRVRKRGSMAYCFTL